MPSISAAQIRAARAMFNLSREALADKTNLSVQTIRNLETGIVSYRSLEIVRQALEQTGAEFIEDDGIRRRSNEVRVMRGPDSTDMFYEDMLQTLKVRGGDLVVLVNSQKMFAQNCGAPSMEKIERLRRLGDLANTKCLLTECANIDFPLPQTEFKTISRIYAGPLPYYIYGNKTALVMINGGGEFYFIVSNSPDTTQSNRDRFNSLWDMAASLAQPTLHLCLVTK